MKTAMFALALGFLATFATAHPADSNHPVCTSTITRFVQFDLSPTTTIFAKTSTATSSVDCNGCGYVTIKSIGGHGPVRHITATVTAPVTTTTTTVCSPSIR